MIYADPIKLVGSWDNPILDLHVGLNLKSIELNKRLRERKIMAVLEVVLTGDYLAETGYIAFGKASHATNRNQPVMVPWDKASAEMRNFWREWARQFTIAHMTKGA